MDSLKSHRAPETEFQRSAAGCEMRVCERLMFQQGGNAKVGLTAERRRAGIRATMWGVFCLWLPLVGLWPSEMAQGSEAHGGDTHAAPAAAPATEKPAASSAPAAPKHSASESDAAMLMKLGGPSGAPPPDAPPAAKKKKKSSHGGAAHGGSSQNADSSAAARAARDLTPLPPPDPVTAEQVLDVSLIEPTTGPLQKGALIPFRYEIRNSSKDVVVIKEVRTTTAEDLPVTFTLSGYGTLTYDEGLDAYLYNSMAQQATQRIFEHGVVLPGEARRIELDLRMLEDRQTLLMRFYMMPMEQFRKVAFVPLEGRDRVTTFQHLEGLPTDFLKANVTPTGPIHDKPVILWEELAGQPLLLLEQRSSRTLPLKPVAMTAEEAKKTSGLTGATTYWSWADGWIVSGVDHSALVNKEGTRMLPLVDPQLFRDIDSGKSKIRVKLTPASQMLKGRFAAREGDGVYTFGDFIEVPKERLWEFFDLARIENMKITREVYLFDAYYYVLTPTP